MKQSIVLLLLSFTLVWAHPTYTGYSGAFGSKGTCASSCHGSGTGTIVVTGIPNSYTPLKTYTITINHNGGAVISNFNASARQGTTAAAAGSFAAGSGSATYVVSGYENGVRASANNFDTATFVWTAPAAGTGNVTFYIAGLQSSKNGPNTKIVVTSTEQSTTVINANYAGPQQFALRQNYPNPFYPATTINYQLPRPEHVVLKVFDSLGKEIATLVDRTETSGNKFARFDAGNLPSGVYFYQLRAGSWVETKKLVLLEKIER